VTVDIVCATLDGGRYLDDFLRSLAAQRHADWRLWVRDDGSTDDTVAIIEEAAASDPRVRLLHRGGPPSGPARAFSWLLTQLPNDAQYVMCADQDDVWLPDKIERTLEAMRAAQDDRAGEPILVHTDLQVVDAELKPLHPSFWQYAGLDPDATTLRRIVVRNVVTGAAMMINRPLLELAGPPPADAYFHDWWLACAAAAFGRIVAVRVATALYRQHGANAVGARDASLTPARLPAAGVAATRARAKFRRELRASATQANAFLQQFGDRLNADDRRFLDEYSSIPDRRLLSRKLALLRYRAIPGDGFLRTLGVVLRG